MSLVGRAAGRRLSRRRPIIGFTPDVSFPLLPDSVPVADDAEPDADALDAGAADDVERRSATVSAAWHGLRLDKVLVEMAGEFSRSHLQGLIEAGHVRVDGVVARVAARKLRAGQRVQADLVPTAESRAFRAEPLALAIVYEDDDLLVVDKPAGLVVHPAAGHWSGTLLNGLLAHHAGASALPRAGIVHRLDKDTSGLMVVGKTLTAVTALVRAIAAREVDRRYRAIAHGALNPPERQVEAPIGRDPRSRTRMAVVASGRPARTDIRRVAAAFDCSSLECRLHTGRTHQIRVHAASIGHPLVGDALYGGRPLLGLTRQALHAHELAFEHPRSGAPLAFAAPPPPDFAAAWAQISASPT
ncbi:MAG: RluA family pseudouridine synthase [Proteobacteria bacterium]|nr:RluA family pseudouridine synthase [Pseudomonadota bacterium]MBS0595967.1 RluA family pseudouridine synthase [Pseudomonadota bacterium]